ncbi:MAG: hypothetical protein ACK52I_19015 [Pseudomonadota bacterium]
MARTAPLSRSSVFTTSRPDRGAFAARAARNARGRPQAAPCIARCGPRVRSGP